MINRPFKDNRGRLWNLKADRSAMARVFIGNGIDLTGGQPVWDRLAADMELVVRVLWSICEPEADQRGITPEDFGRSLYSVDGRTIGGAVSAMLCSFADNYPRRERMILQRAVAAACV